jgi:transcriptional regulator with XRE-family HTH domain
MMKQFKHIAKLVKDARLSHPKKYSQAELSDALGYKNGQFISNIERGLCSVPLRSLYAVTEVLNIPADKLKEALLLDFEGTLTDHFKPGSKRDRELVEH